MLAIGMGKERIVHLLEVELKYQIMAIVNVDLSEYDSLRNRNKELEEQVKELKKQVEDLKSGSKVIIRTIEEEANPYGFKRNRIVSESYVGFEDVRLKVEEAMKADIAFTIKNYEEAAERYEEKRKNYEKTVGGEYEARLVEQDKIIDEHERLLRKYEKALDKIERLSYAVFGDLRKRFFKPTGAIQTVSDIITVAEKRDAEAAVDDSGIRC